MTETEAHRDLRHLLVGAAKAHHAVHPGPSDAWANWYAEHIFYAVPPLTTSEPTLETLEGWLVDADTRYADENPESDWPDCYATWILEWDAAAEVRPTPVALARPRQPSPPLLPSSAMTLDLGTPEHGCLMLADISGYTEYMGSTELMHAQDVIADLLETIVGAVEPVFTLSKLEGDAAFAYVNTETVNTSMLMDTVESAYFAFQKRLRDIVHATSCPCDACIRIPDLDLKFFIHDGEYVVRHIARSEELTGPDVILVHRLAKGTATDIVGKNAYAVYTKATLDAMAMSPSILGFVPHTEDLDGIGEVEVFVQDLSIRWTFEQERNRDFVNASDAVYEVSFDTPAAPEVVWDHLTDPVKRPEWQKLVSEVVTQTEGRRGVGTINHCMHGSDVILEHVSDWRPFSYLTLRYALGDIEDWAWTLLLDPDGGTTKVTMRISDPGGGAWEMIGPDFSASVDDQAGELEALLLTATG